MVYRPISIFMSMVVVGIANLILASSNRNGGAGNFKIGGVEIVDIKIIIALIGL